MNKTDKIVISLILILAIVMGLVLPIKSIATAGEENNPVIYAENYNAELEANSTAKTEFKYGKILQCRFDCLTNAVCRKEEREARKLHLDCAAVRDKLARKIRAVELLKPHAVVVIYGRHLKGEILFAERFFHRKVQPAKVARK